MAEYSHEEVDKMTQMTPPIQASALLILKIKFLKDTKFLAPSVIKGFWENLFSLCTNGGGMNPRNSWRHFCLFYTPGRKTTIWQKTDNLPEQFNYSTAEPLGYEETGYIVNSFSFFSCKTTPKGAGSSLETCDVEKHLACCVSTQPCPDDEAWRGSASLIWFYTLCEKHGLQDELIVWI